MSVPRVGPVVAALLWLFAGTARADGAEEADPWFGPDKALHFGVSAGIGAGGYALGAALWRDEPPRLVLGGALALAAGVGKELVDLSSAGHASWKDLAWDVAGTAVGLALAYGVAQLVRWLTDDHPPAAVAQRRPSSFHWGWPRTAVSNSGPAWLP